MGQRTRDRQFRRLEERSRTSAPLPVAWLGGIALGALAGAGFLAWEATVLQTAGIGFALGTHGLALLGLYPTIGAAIGLVGGSIGLWGPRWGLAAAMLGGAWLASAPLASSAEASGVPAVITIGFCLVVGAVLSQLAGRIPGPTWMHQGVAAFTLAGLALVAPFQQHVVAGLGTAGWVVTLLLLLVAGALAGITTAFTGDERPPVIPLVLWAALGGVGAVASRARVEPPAWEAATAEGTPIVLVVVSGLRSDRTGFSGYDRGTTPNLDKFAHRSLVFEDAHATSNWSVPSIASMLSGRLPYSHGAGLNDGRGPTGSPLRADVVTVPITLGKAGWTSAGVTGDPSMRQWFLDSGFDTWHDAPDSGVVPALWTPLVVAEMDPLRWAVRVDAGTVTDRAVALLETREAGGWFLFVHYADAGGPFDAEAVDEQAVGFTTRPWPSDRYDAALHRVDRELARLLEAVGPDALVVVAGDRGVQLSEQRAANMQGVPGMRYGHTMFEELLSVPIVVRAPGRGAARIPGAVSVADIGPTLVRAAGADEMPKADGSPLERVFGGPQTDRVVVAQSTLFGPEQQAVIMGHHKLIDTATGRTPLFDLEGDPSESFALTTGAETDSLERRLLAVLPPPGAGVELQEPPSMVLRIGQIGSRFLGR